MIGIRSRVDLFYLAGGLFSSCQAEGELWIGALRLDARQRVARSLSGLDDRRERGAGE